MGIGNLQDVLRDYGDDEVPYAQLFFDSTPLHHPAAWSRLASFGDDSSTYLWRVEAARDIMRRWREDPAALERLDVRQTAKASAEEVLHPRSSTEIFDTPGDVEDAEDDGDLVALPVRRLADAGITIDPGMGELAGRLDQERTRYRALRPEALAMLEYLGAGTQAISGTGPLIVTSTVRDTRYQRVLASENIEATHAYSLHTTGFTFDIERDYASGRQAPRVPVPARPPHGAGPHRLGARAGRDPHHGLGSRGRGAAAASPRRGRRAGRARPGRRATA